MDDQSAASESDETSAEQQTETKRYARQKLFCGLADSALDLVFLAIVAFVFARTIDDWLLGFGWTASIWIRLAVFYSIVTVVHFCISFPLTFYAGFRLEHQFNLSRLTFVGWFWRYVKGNSLAFAFGLLMVEGLFLLIMLTGPYWWLAAAGGAFVINVVLSQLVPILILPLFYKVERLEDDELTARFRKLSKGTGLSIEGIYRLHLSAETVKANAALTGLGRTRRVLLADTLLDEFTPEEIEVVLAHEVGHHVHRHIPKMIAMGLAYMLLSFFLCDRILVAWVGEGFRYDTLPVYALPMLMFVVTASSFLLGPLKNAISRQFERQCDRYALDRTGLHEAFQSAFHKLAKQNKADPDPHALEVFLFHDHPPITERLRMADNH